LPAARVVPFVNFHRVPFVILSVVVLVIAGSLAYFWKTYKEPLPPEYGWGAADTLSLNLTLERNAITAADTLDFTARIMNTGTEKVRLFPWDWVLYYTLRMSNSSSHIDNSFTNHQTPPDDFAKNLSASEFNRMLVVLKPNGTYRMQGTVKNDDSWASGWPLRPGFNWYLQVVLNMFNIYKPYPALPFWAGTVQSDWQEFTVLP
jgi:hypothetical protein